MSASEDAPRPVIAKLELVKELVSGSRKFLSSDPGLRRRWEELVRWEVFGPLLLVICATSLWAASLGDVDPGRINDLGLVSVLPLIACVALATLIVSFCVAVHRQQVREKVLFLHVVALIGMIHGTPAVLYGTLRYSWAWKHLGIVDYIQRYGTVNPQIPVMSAYHNWPGFFILNALITDIAGFKTSLSFAAWAPMVFNLLWLGPLLLILNTRTDDRRLIWLSLWFFYLTNWVGQDYFAPQALAFFFYLVILGICLTWFGFVPPTSRAAIKRWLKFDWAVTLFHSIVARKSGSHTVDNTGPPFQRIGLMVIAVVLFMAITSSHQLTPFMTIAPITLLVIFQFCNARGLPILMIVLTATWIIYVAVAFLAGSIESVIRSVGQLLNNVDGNLIELGNASPGQRLVALIGRGLTASVWGLAFLGGIRRLRQGFWDVPFVLVAVAPFLLLAGNSYGGEMLFRVYLFSLPFMAFFVAAFLYPSAATGTSWRTLAMVVLLSGGLLTGFYFAHFGKDRQYYFTRNEVAASEYLIGVAPAGSLIIEGSQNYPSRFQNYERYSYRTLANEEQETRTKLIENPVAFILPRMEYRQYTASYLIITRSQKATIDMVGVMPPGSLDKIEQTLMQSPAFKVIYANKDATIFTVSDRDKGAGQ